MQAMYIRQPGNYPETNIKENIKKVYYRNILETLYYIEIVHN